MCARGFSTKNKRQEINDKVSKTLTNRTLSEETKMKISTALKGREITWATQNENSGKKIAEGLRKHYQENPFSEERRKMMSDFAKERGLGGHTSKLKLFFKKNDGTEVYLQSSYEITYAKLLEENKIDWIRPDPVVWVDANGVSHKYYGDFYLTKFKLYIDTKNDYLIKKDAEKIKRVIEQNKISLKVLSGKELDWLPISG
jgi:hypothetical protein